MTVAMILLAAAKHHLPVSDSVTDLVTLVYRRLFI